MLSLAVGSVDLGTFKCTVLYVCCIKENAPESSRTVVHRENNYIRIYGHVRAFQDQRNCVAFRTVPVSDLNELTTHMLEVFATHLQLSKPKQARP